MSRVEFAKIIAYISLGCGKTLSTESQEVYYDLLGGLPVAYLQSAARSVLLKHTWASFPTIAELHASAMEDRPKTEDEIKRRVIEQRATIKRLTQEFPD